MIRTSHLHRPLHDRLMDLLKSLSPADWQRPTYCPLWTVQDIASHLLDTTLRRLSMHRDRFVAIGTGASPAPDEDFISFLNRLNSDWVQAMRRVSPVILIQLLEEFGPQQNEFLAALDPEGKAFWPVAWAGEVESKNWFDVTREYTERWLHQQQIRVAVNAPDLITTFEFYHPVLHAFIRGIPHTLRDLDYPAGTQLRFVIEGEAGGTWILRRDPACWAIVGEDSGAMAAEVVLSDRIAWLLFSKGVRFASVADQVQIMGLYQNSGVIFAMNGVLYLAMTG